MNVVNTNWRNKTMDKLIDAIIDRKFNKVKKLMGQGADPNLTIDDVSGLSAMHFSCQSSDWHI